MRKLFVVSITITSMLLLFLTSCEKDKETDLNPNNLSELKVNHFPLDIGDSWIYQYFYIDSLGNETVGVIDTITITRDTIINGSKYSVFENTNHFQNAGNYIKMWRDSLGYIVNEKGFIRFAENNFTDTLSTEIRMVNEQDTLYTLTYKMEKSDNLVTVPTGTYEVLNVRGTVIVPITIPDVDSPRYTNNYYAKNIGLILGTSFYFSSPIPSRIEKRLINYHVQE